MHTLIVFSHLRWDFVYQRPQHVLSRIAAKWPVLFVEEPIAGDLHLEVSDPMPGVTVLRPHTPVAGHGFDNDRRDVLALSFEEGLDRVQIVVVGQEGVLDDVLGHSGRAGDGLGGLRR